MIVVIFCLQIASQLQTKAQLYRIINLVGFTRNDVLFFLPPFAGGHVWVYGVYFSHYACHLLSLGEEQRKENDSKMWLRRSVPDSEFNIYKSCIT